jgi:hypothetical protein
MAWQSAGFEVGGALGAAVVGVALVWLADYAAVYRLLGLGLPLLVVPLLGRTRVTEPRQEPRERDQAVATGRDGGE